LFLFLNVQVVTSLSPQSSACFLPCLRDYPLSQLADVDNQCDGSVPQNGRSRYFLNVPVEPAHCFDYRLVLADNLIHNQSYSSIIGSADNNLLDCRACTCYPEPLPQRYVRDNFPADVRHLLTMHLPDIFSGQFDAFFNCGKR